MDVVQDEDAASVAAKGSDNASGNALLRQLAEERQSRQANSNSQTDRSSITKTARPASTGQRMLGTIDAIRCTPEDESGERCVECNGFETDINPFVRCMFHADGCCVQEDDSKRGAAWHRSCCRTKPRKGEAIVCYRHEAQARFQLANSGQTYMSIPVPGFEDPDPNVPKKQEVSSASPQATCAPPNSPPSVRMLMHFRISISRNHSRFPSVCER